MKKLFLVLTFSILCLGNIAQADNSEADLLLQEANHAKLQAEAIHETMVSTCEAATKSSTSYKESLSYQIESNDEFLAGNIAFNSNDHNLAKEKYKAVVKASDSAIDLCSSTNQLVLSDENYDSAFTKNIVMRIGDGLTKTTQDKLRSIFTGELLRTVNRILGALAILFIVILGLKYIMAMGDEEKITQYKQQLAWTVLGLTIISLAEFIGFELFNPSGNEVLSTSTQIKLSEKVSAIVRFFEYSAGAFFLVSALITGYKLVMNGEGEESSTFIKTFFKSMIMGSIMILMSEIIIRIFSFQDSADKTTEMVVTEVAGLINFVLSLVAIAAMAMLVLSSLYFVISFGNEEQTTKAKGMIKTSILGIIIASASYVLVRFLIR